MAVNYEDAIAIIGYSGQFTKASNRQEFWDILEKGRFVGTRLSREDLVLKGVDERTILNSNFVPISMHLEEADFFDNHFFNISDKQSLLMDPQNRLLLQTTWHALEKSGYSNLTQADELKVGVFAGKNPSQHIINFSNDVYSGGSGLSEQLEFEISNEVDFLANWISYKFGFNGLAVNIQTACSTSFSAIAAACQNLLLYYCDLAVVSIGGITSSNSNFGYVYQPNNILSQDGLCRPFDAGANGTVPGNGVGTLILKRYDDALKDDDYIDALILGIGINNDGNNKQDFMAPGLIGQADAIGMAFERSGLSSGDIDIVETHGTGTILGDPLEFRALSDAFFRYGNERRKSPCYLGSAKANFGHLFAGAGMVSLFKVLESLKRKIIPPMANFNRINNNINLDSKLFAINRMPIPWERNDGNPRRAGISSFGFGGTNTHIIIEEVPANHRENKVAQKKRILANNIWFCSARSNVEQLEKISNDLISLKDTYLPQDISFSSLVGRKHFEYRKAIVLDKNCQATVNRNSVAKLPCNKTVEICFMFGGQGGCINQTMGKALYSRFPIFKETINRAYNYFGREKMEKIWPLNNKSDWDLSNPSILQPAIYLYQSALYRLYLSLGVKPNCLIGHSLGEVAAAYASGSLSFEDALKLAMIRGEVFSKIPTGVGSMAVIFSNANSLPKMDGSLVVAAYNAKDITVISGYKEEVFNYVGRCSEADIYSVPLQTTHAFHNPLLSDLGLSLENNLGYLKSAKKPTINVYSTLTGEEYLSNFNEAYWDKQAVSPTLFWPAIDNIIGAHPNIGFLELSPAVVLNSLLKNLNHPVVTSCFTSETEEEDLLNSIASLYELGFVPQKEALFGNVIEPLRISLPAYPFEKNRFSLDAFKSIKPDEHVSISKNNGQNLTSNNNVPDIYGANNDEDINELTGLIIDYWRPHFFQVDIFQDSDFFALGGTSLSAIQIIEKIALLMGIKLSVVEFMRAKTPANLAILIAEKLTDDE